jgi:hypothetical protein
MERWNFPATVRQLSLSHRMGEGWGEGISAFKSKHACADLGPTGRRHVEAIFHDNAARLIAGILERK